MKIMLLSLNYAPELTGIGKFNAELCEWLAARGHAVQVVCAPPYYPGWSVHSGYVGWRYTKEKLGRANVTRCPIYLPKKVTGRRRLIHLASFGLSSFPVALWHAFAWRPDVILMTEPPLAAAPAAILASRLCGCRAVLHVQDFETDAAFELGLLPRGLLETMSTKVERWLMRQFSLVSTISPRMLERLLTKGVALDRTALVSNWADLHAEVTEEKSRAWRQAAGIQPDELMLLYAGNMGMKQGLETLVEAARLASGRTDWRFVFCGDGAGRARLETSAAGLRNVTFLPLQPLEALATMLKAADIHLLPQRKGAADLVMPSKLGNILASGRPVIAGAIAGTQLHEAVQSSGIAAPPEDAPSLLAAIETLAGHPELRRALGDNARREACARWNKDRILMTFEELMAEGTPPSPAPELAESTHISPAVDSPD